MMSNTVPLPNLPHWAFVDKHDLVPSEVRVDIKRYGESYAAAVSAAKDAEIAQLRADLIKSLADNKGLRAEVAGLREDAERYRWLRDKLDVNDRATWSIFMAEGVEQWDAAIDAALAARKGEA